MTRIPLTNSWQEQLDDVIGYIEISDTAKAIFFYEMLKMRPDQFRFGISYSKDEKGKYTLLGVSLVSKYPSYHPIIVKRRLADKIRVKIRKMKRSK